MKTHSVDVLLVRMDRIGDLVLNLPVDQSELLKSQKIHWFITKGLGFVVDQAVPSRSYSEYERPYSLKQLRAMVREIKQLNPRQAVVFHAPWWIGLALWLAGVPTRIGRHSQWHSFLFFNRGVRQKRSQAEMHESEYNFRLLESGMRAKPSTSERPYLKLESSAEKDVLAKHKLEPQKYYVVHPGMGGSALNWPTRHYKEAIEKLSQEHPVVITGTKTDESYLAPLKEQLGQTPNVLWLDAKLSGPELIGMLQQAKGVIAPSTGVVHLAASAGAPTVGLYSSIRVESARRWGPRGPHASAVESTASLDGTPEQIMEQISPEAVIKKLSESLTEPAESLSK